MSTPTSTLTSNAIGTGPSDILKAAMLPPSLTPTSSTSSPDLSSRIAQMTDEERAELIRQLARLNRINAPAEFQGGGRRFLLSICPWDLNSDWFNHGGGRMQYRIPGQPKGKHFVLPVQNTFTLIQDLTQSEDEIISSGLSQVPRTITSEAIVNNLLKSFVGDHYANRGGGTLGVMEIAGPTPTPAELSKINHLQSTFFRTLVTEADTLHASHKTTSIRNEHRRALEWLPGEDPKRHLWYVITGTEGNVPFDCPACAGSVPMVAFMCPTCRIDLAQFFLDRERRPDPKVMPGVAEEVAYRLKKEATAARKGEKEKVRSTPVAPVAPVEACIGE